ncbi:MAG: ABC transporter ATP-binding protein [Bacteroidaceae bacterium]|nr:ABC transporter ATP-binding protein [Bacteroidaceae bacterium]
MRKNEPSERSSNYDRFSRESLRREWNVLTFAWKMAERYHLMLLVVMILEIVIGLFPSMAVYFLQDAVSGAGHDILSLVTKENFAYIILVLIVYFLLQKGVNVITTFAIIDVEYNIRMKYLSKILTVSTGDISNNLDNRSAFSMTREASMTSGLIPMIYRSFLQAPVAIVSAVVLLMIISPRMLTIVAAMVAVIIGITLLMRSRLKQFNREQNDATSSLLQYFNEWLSGHRIFHVYGAEDFFRNKMTSTFDKISDVNRKHKLYGTAQSIMMEILTYVAFILFFVFLSDDKGSVDIGIVLSFPALILLIRSEVLKLFGGYQQLATTESSISRLQLVLQMEAPANTGQVWNEHVGNIELRNLSYGYNPNERILDHASLQLSQGRLNVLTGPNGTGKSTTINLILGLFKPQEGAVLYNGKDISDYTRTSLLTQFAIVEQEPFVFQGSLMENITLGRQISEGTIRKYLHEFAMDYLMGDSGDLSMGIGAKGRALSSGEKQRLALIRALVGEPSVIILDEPTSNIDQATAAFIRDVMNELAQQHLVICVSHDPALTTNKDFNIFQIENGNYIQRYGN